MNSISRFVRNVLNGNSSDILKFRTAVNFRTNMGLSNI